MGRPDDSVEVQAAAAARSIHAASSGLVPLGSPARRGLFLRRQPDPRAPTAGVPSHQQSGFVKRLDIECVDHPEKLKPGWPVGILTMVTSGGSHTFVVRKCRIPTGHYTAKIAHKIIDKHPKATITLHGDTDEIVPADALEVDFSNAEHEKGFRSPAELLAGQDRVDVHVRHRPLTDIELEEEIVKEQEVFIGASECLLPKEDNDVIKRHPLDHALVDIGKAATLWSEPLPLGPFGLVNCGLKAAGHAKAATKAITAPAHSTTSALQGSSATAKGGLRQTRSSRSPCTRTYPST